MKRNALTAMLVLITATPVVAVEVNWIGEDHVVTSYGSDPCGVWVEPLGGPTVIDPARFLACSPLQKANWQLLYPVGSVVDAGDAAPPSPGETGHPHGDVSAEDLVHEGPSGTREGLHPQGTF